MVYIFLLRPNQRSNQLFAAYMLLISISSYTILVASTAQDAASIFDASRVHALAIMVSAPLLWLVDLQLFIPHTRFFRFLRPILSFLIVVPLIFGFLDIVGDGEWLFRFVPTLYAGGYVQISETLNGRLSRYFYTFYFIFLNSLLLLPIFIFAFTQIVPKRLQRAARIFLLLSISVGLLYLPWVEVPPALRSMLVPVFAALGAAWVVNSSDIFSPMALAMKQVVDTVTVGLLVFDEHFVLRDANAATAKLLPVDLSCDVLTLSLPQLLQRMLPEAKDKEALIALETAVTLKPEEIYSEEIVLQDGRSSLNTTTAWILLKIHPVHDKNKVFLGLSCSVEDLTVERRTQGYITETHRALEQYATNQALLNDITQATISSINFNETLSTLASSLVALFNADHCYISLFDENLHKPIPVMAQGVDLDRYLSLRLEPDEPSVTSELFLRRQAITIENCLQTDLLSPRIVKLFPTRSMLALPMMADGDDLGALLIGFNHPRKFTPEEVKLGEQIARQVSLAIYKNRLLEVEREQRNLLEALQAAGNALTSTLDFEQVIDRILEEIARVVPYDTANFALVEDGEARIVRCRGFDRYSSISDLEAAKLRFNIAQTDTFRIMYESKRPFRISSTTNAPAWTPSNVVDHVKSWLGVPLIVAGEVTAFLSLDKMEADYYQLHHEENLAAFANQAALALQHARLFTEIQRRVTELEALSVVSAALRSTETLTNILQVVLKEMASLLSARVGVAFLINDEKTAVVSQGSYPSQFYPDGIRYNLGEGITGSVAQTGEIYIAADINTNPLRTHQPNEPADIKHLKTTIALPLISEEGILGVIHIGLNSLYQFAEDEIHTLQAISNIVANGLQRIRVMQTLEARVAERTHDLETANEQLQELDKLKTKFIADVSHELRTPVTNLSLYVNLLQYGKPEKQPHYQTVLQQQANRLTKLVEATLGLSRLEISVDNMAISAVNLNDIVEQIVLEHQARADALNIQLSSSLQPNLPTIWGEATQLTQLTTNLVTNALNYTPEGYVHVETFLADEKTICLKVSDSGIGISEAELPHLFDRFYRGQLTGQSNIPGTGLGLAIVKEIVDLHQGKIEVTSHVQKGSVFLIQLPIDKLLEKT